MQNYFEFYQLPISFIINKRQLKRQFYKISKQYHPDFFAQATDAEQQHALEMSTLNNKAYRTLNDDEAIIKYVLQLKEVLVEGEKYTLPPTFLMQMMDINEQLMELQFDHDPQKVQQLNQEITAIEQTLKIAIEPILQNYNDQLDQTENLKKVKEFYYKNRYLLRIKENLSKFANRFG